MKFSGEIDVANEANPWIYQIPRCVISERKISFDFSGIKDGCKFTGHCIVNERSPQKYSGLGKFQYEGYEAYESHIEVLIKLEDPFLAISGKWLEDGVEYRMNGELEKSL
ncbi:hypothetical protein OU800_09960 [Pseudomonas sp. GOM7]|uniref:hypothetical protein n=1 Tax=Pseudomonas sp. GOM7 TaxID=2998079 RepID=UPI00227AE1BD|nr:hypothetical protein [Pseudomonas sp. GOM7]WAJ39529.1 hypothetical protein OU800_09960 [Pseudomonas sp. GOM7]